jgi:hypothetical protein
MVFIIAIKFKTTFDIHTKNIVVYLSQFVHFEVEQFAMVIIIKLIFQTVNKKMGFFETIY